MTPDATPVSLPPALRAACRALDEKKAEDLRVLDVSRKSSITDYLVLATGTSEPHLRALRAELDKILDKKTMRLGGHEGGDASGWTVIDAFDFIVHLFTQEMRQHFRLDVLWSDGASIPLASVLATEPPPAPARKPRARKAPAPTTAKAKAAKTPRPRKAAPRKRAQD